MAATLERLILTEFWGVISKVHNNIKLQLLPFIFEPRVPKNWRGFNATVEEIGLEQRNTS
jgi:hypothetical protein